MSEPRKFSENQGDSPRKFVERIWQAIEKNEDKLSRLYEQSIDKINELILRTKEKMDGNKAKSKLSELEENIKFLNKSAAELLSSKVKNFQRRKEKNLGESQKLKPEERITYKTDTKLPSGQSGKAQSTQRQAKTKSH